MAHRGHGKHYVYLFRSTMKARFQDGKEIPVYKIGYSTDVRVRGTSFAVPCNVELVDSVEFDTKDVALTVERLMISYRYPSQRLKGTNRSTEWIYLEDDQLKVILGDLVRFKDRNLVARFTKDMPKVQEEISSWDGALRKTYEFLGETPSEPELITEITGDLCQT